jgi:glycosyltransferase involved in cell wall biosynthesis
MKDMYVERESMIKKRSPKISIIVPIYKVEPFLRRCIDSILAQTFTDFELLLIEDGSPDHCPEICDEYAARDPRILVIHKENSGLSDARNAGLAIARGEYIGFVDSDDFIHPQTYELALNAATRYNADITQWAFIEFSDETGDPASLPLSAEPTVLEIVEAPNLAKEYYPKIRYQVNAAVWNKLYVRSIFDNVRFPKNLIYEDYHVVLPTLNAAKKLVLLKEQLYYYYQRSDSIMHETYSPKCFSACMVQNKHLAFFQEQNSTVQLQHAVHDYLDRYIQHTLMVHLQYKQYKKDFTPYRRQYRRMLFRILFNPHICRMKKLVAVLLILQPQFAHKLCQKYFPECLYPSMR